MLAQRKRNNFLTSFHDCMCQGTAEKSLQNNIHLTLTFLLN